MKKYLFLLLTLSVLMACSSPSQTEKELLEVLNKPLEINMFSTVLHQDSALIFERFRDAHEFLSVVYLQDGCNPCYPKFIEWHQNMDSLDVFVNHTVLFVIQGNSYTNFMHRVLDTNYVDDSYYTIMDPDFKLLDKNKTIPRWIIDSSILIDSENKIKMVGAPWANDDMKKLFNETVNNEK